MSFKYEKSTRTIRTIPENYWVATLDSWDGAVKDKLDDYGTLLAAAGDLLAICQEIASDSKVDLVNSERRIRLYSAIKKAGGAL